MTAPHKVSTPLPWRGFVSLDGTGCLQSERWIQLDALQRPGSHKRICDSDTPPQYLPQSPLRYKGAGYIEISREDTMGRASTACPVATNSREGPKPTSHPCPFSGACYFFRCPSSSSSHSMKQGCFTKHQFLVFCMGKYYSCSLCAWEQLPLLIK